MLPKCKCTASGALMLMAAAILIITASAQTCIDKVKNGVETDVDCGGGTCPPCLTARVCLAARDCLSGNCLNGKCQEPPECWNKVKDRRETDTDCGGGECYAACYVGKSCVGTWDCRSRICSSGKCVEAVSCDNLFKDGLETDWNCGGGVCQPCGGKMVCTNNADCRSGVCTNGRCVAPATCNNGILDAGEGFIDCGGACALCGTTKTCNVNEDCLSNTCTSGRCAEAPHCYNRVKDGRETDVDCGGGACNAACDLGKSCLGTWDCKSRICSNGVCVASLTSPSPSPRPPSPSPRPSPPAPPAASCSDGIMNNGEVDVDCGGPNCPACQGGATCYNDSDCGSGYCIFN